MLRFGLLLGSMLVLWSTVPAFGDLLKNGGFDTGDLTGWTSSGPVTVEAVGGTPPAAVLNEDESLLDGTDLRQIFEIPAGRLPSLTFTFAMFVEGESPVPFPPDALVVSLLDPGTLDPLVSTSGFSDFFAVELDGYSEDFLLDFDPQLAAVSDLSDLTTGDVFGIGGVVTVDVSFLPAGTQAMIDFKVAGGFDGFRTRVLIDGVTAVIEARLDIKPESCPNPISTRNRGVVPIAIVGTDLFDPTQIDVNSIMLARADGAGGAVSPLEDRDRIEDVATPFEGDLCDCHILGGDGVDDLSLKFPAPELIEILALESVPEGTYLSLVVTGALLDGTGFRASDCIRVGRAR